MRRSPTVEIWRAEARLEGFQEGRNESRNEAKVRCPIEIERQTLRMVLENRFSCVPDDMLDAIDSTSDIEKLNRWFWLALRAQLAELRDQICSAE